MLLSCKLFTFLPLKVKVSLSQNKNNELMTTNAVFSPVLFTKSLTHHCPGKNILNFEKVCTGCQDSSYSGVLSAFPTALYLGSAVSHHDYKTSCEILSGRIQDSILT